MKECEFRLSEPNFKNKKKTDLHFIITNNAKYRNIKDMLKSLNCITMQKTNILKPKN